MAQFVKNTDKPTPDSVLWEFADDWKISGSSGVPYASLPGVERKNDELYEGLRQIIKSKNLENVEYQSYHFALTFFDNKDKPKDPNIPSNWHVFVFEKEEDAKKKNDYQKRFINWDFKPSTSTTVPKAQGQGQGQQQSLVSTGQSFKPQVMTVPSSPPPPTTGSIPQYITTFTDPIEVEAHDEETINDLTSKGFSYLPSTLVNQNVWKETTFDDDGNNIGTSIRFLMGRIINVKISDK